MEYNSKYIEVRLLKPFDVLIRGDIEHVKQTLKQLPELFEELNAQFPQGTEEATSATSMGQVSSTFPQLSGNPSLTEALTLVAKSDWLKPGRETGEFQEVFAANALTYKLSNVSDRLGKMTKQGIFRRVPKDSSVKKKRWIYVPGPNA